MNPETAVDIPAIGVRRSAASAQGRIQLKVARRKIDPRSSELAGIRAARRGGIKKDMLMIVGIGAAVRIAKDIESHLRKVHKFDTPTCTVQSLADMSLWELENFLDFSRYDYLSFDGDEEGSPED